VAVEKCAKVPLLVIPCYEPDMPRIDGDESFFRQGRDVCPVAPGIHVSRRTFA